MTRLRWETRIGSIDAVVLIGGIASLLIWYPPAIVGFAGAHLLCGFLVALNKFGLGRDWRGYTRYPSRHRVGGLAIRP